MERLGLRVRRSDAELVLAELIAMCPNGVEEVDICEQVVEYALYGAEGGLPELDALRAAAGGALLEIVHRVVADDWSERWRDFHRPLVLGDRLCVRPPWEPPIRDVAHDIVIDPGRAFGTGAHPTTRLCLELLLSLAPSAGQPFAAVDLGCGSGVLAIVAAACGWRQVLALDHDPACIEATSANAAVNGVAEAIAVRHFDLCVEPVPAAPLVLANLLAPLLRAWCDQLLDGRARTPALVIASGLLAVEADSVSEQFAACGLNEADRLIGGEWTALLLRSSSAGVGSRHGP